MQELFSIDPPKIISSKLSNISYLLYNYQIEHYIFAFFLLLLGFILTMLAGKIILPYFRSKKLGQSIRELGPASHYSKSGTPTMGGVIFLGIFIILCLSAVSWDSFWLWVILISCIGFGLIGFIDDYRKLILKSSRGIKARYKIIGQLLISIFIFLFIYALTLTHNFNMPFTKDIGIIYPIENFYVPFISNPISNSIVLLVIFYIIIPFASSNSVNLTDGLDGLASGVMIPVLFLLALTAIFHNYSIDNSNVVNLHDSFSLLLIISILIGCLIGFMWYNNYPAQVFMGDTGSLALGGILGTIVLILKLEILLLLFGFVFVIEALSVLMQILYFKFTGGKRIFLMAPLHHHYELKGWKETKVVVVFYTVSFIFSVISFLIIFI